MSTAVSKADGKKSLLVSASEDLDAARWAYAARRYPVCAYLCQQAVEKSLKSAKAFAGKREKRDEWSHNLLDCTNWSPALKKRFKRRLARLTPDQKRSRYFTPGDYMQPWHRYKGANTVRKLDLAREVFAASLAYMHFDEIGGRSLIECAQRIELGYNIKTLEKRFKKLLYEALDLMSPDRDFEEGFVLALSDVLLSKCRFYPRKDVMWHVINMGEELQSTLFPEYLWKDEVTEDFREMYASMARGVSIRRVLPEQAIISRMFLELARYDLVSSVMLELGGFRALSLFYADQSIEKSLKSIINLKAKTPYLKGHNLVQLCQQAQLTDMLPTIAENPLLNKYLEIRYGDGQEIIDGEGISEEELWECQITAERFYKLACHIRLENGLDIPK
ncbi:MAG: HEPN domain-containing protein [Candidatus Micrarchaeia archaeon]